MNITYTCGAFDILREKDLLSLDRQIQINKDEEDSLFGLGIYDENLCQNLGLNAPLKSLEDRMEIAKQIRGIDFVFPVSSLEEKLLQSKIIEVVKQLKDDENNKNKKYELGYAPRNL